jgi:hypothetical protein
VANRLVPPAFARGVLLHDTEEFLGGLLSPFKLLVDRDHLKAVLAPVREASARESASTSCARSESNQPRLQGNRAARPAATALEVPSPAGGRAD